MATNTLHPLTDRIGELPAPGERVEARPRLDKIQREFTTFVRFLRLIFPYYDKIISIILLITVGVPLAEMSVFLSRFQIDEVVLKEGKPVAERVHLFVLILAAQLLLMFLYYVFFFVWSVFFFYLNLKMTIEIKRRFYNHLHKLSLEFLRTRPIGEHMFRTESDTSVGPAGLVSMITESIPDLYRNIYTLIWSAVLLAMVDWKIAVLTLFYVIPYTGAAHFLYTRQKSALRNHKIQDQRVHAMLRDGIAGYKVVKGFGRIQYQTLRYTRRILEERRAWWWLVWVQILTTSIVLWAFQFTMENGIYIYIIVQCMHGHLSYGEFLVALQLAWSFRWPLERIVSLIQGIRLQLVPAERVLETLDVKPDIIDAIDAVSMPPIKGKVEFRNVTFSYVPGIPVLRNLNITINPGESVALVGPTGAGKTTMMYLLLRLFEPQEGQILVDDIDIRRVKMATIKAQLAVVLQETFLFGGTFADNIRYGNLKATDQQVAHAARSADIHDFIVSLPDGYNHDLGEGRKLSGGQQQRMGIARALVRDPRILLLDEATASLDSLTESRIVQTVEKAMRGRTTLMISHRLITVTGCDRILVLDDGQIVEAGEHHELLKRGGLFKRMWEEQTRGELRQ